MYYVAEMITSSKFRTVAKYSDIAIAQLEAERLSSRTGVPVEIQDEIGRCLRLVDTWRDDDVLYS